MALAPRLVVPRRALEYFERVEPELYRLVMIDAPSFRRAVEEALGLRATHLALGGARRSSSANQFVTATSRSVDFWFGPRSTRNRRPSGETS